MRRRAPITRRLARGLLLAAGVAGMGGAAAQSRTHYSVVVPIEVERDSNPNMTPGDSKGTTWLRVRPSVSAGFVSGTEEYDVEAALTAEKSSNHDIARDRLDPRVRGTWKHADDINTTQLAVLLDRRAYRALDVREHVPVGVDAARTLLALSGTWRRELDARTSATADLGQDWERFSDDRTPDFRRTSAALRFTRQQDERRSWYAGVNGQWYRSQGTPDPALGPVGGTHSSVAGAVLGITQAVSDALRVDANAGPMHFSNASKKNDWQAAVKVDYTAERWVAALELARRPGVNASRSGLFVTDEVRAHLRYDIAPLSRIEFEAGHSRETQARSRRSLASVAWVRQWSPAWELAVKASTLQQKDLGGTARGTRIALVLTYRGSDF